MSTAQDRGREWEVEGSQHMGLQLHSGSGNRSYCRLDGSVAGLVVVSFKHCDGDSIRLTKKDLDEAASVATGPSATDAHVTPIIAARIGALGRRLGVVDLDALVDWIRTPPALLPSTRSDELRVAARTPTLLRG